MVQSKTYTKETMDKIKYIKEKLEKVGFVLGSTDDELNMDQIRYTCTDDHVVQVKLQAFKLKAKANKLCNKCCGSKVGRRKGVKENAVDSAYATTTAYLKDNGYVMVSSFEEFNYNEDHNKKTFTITCSKNHTCTLTLSVYRTRKYRKMELCTVCFEEAKAQVKLEKKTITVKAKPTYNLGETKYGNYKAYLEQAGFTLTSTYADFQENRISFICPQQHERTITAKYMGVRKHSDIVMDDVTTLCSECIGEPQYWMKKPYTFPSGRVEFVMGYEPHCLDLLLETYDEQDITVKTKLIPTFNYKKLHKRYHGEFLGRYYPDIMVPDKIIEVKSAYTYMIDEENTNRKLKIMAEAGYNAELWIFDKDLTLTIVREEARLNKAYETTIKFLKEKGCVMVTNMDDFNQKKDVMVKCGSNHEFKLTSSTLNNLKTKHNNGSNVVLCKDCSKLELIHKKMKRLQLNTNHTIIAVEGRNVTFNCGNCGSMQQTFETNLKRTTCCQNCK